MSQPYILRRDGRDYQAPGLEAMRQWAQDGRVLPSDMVYSPKYQSWYRARDLRELRDVLPNVEAAPVAAAAPPAPPPKQFWLRKGDQSYGADSLDVILKWASEGNISPDDFIYHPAYSKWFRAGDSPQLASRFPPHIAHQPPFLPPMDDPMRGRGQQPNPAQQMMQPSPQMQMQMQQPAQPQQPVQPQQPGRGARNPELRPSGRTGPSMGFERPSGALEGADSVAKTVMDFRAVDLRRQLLERGLPNPSTDSRAAVSPGPTSGQTPQTRPTSGQMRQVSSNTGSTRVVGPTSAQMRAAPSLPQPGARARANAAATARSNSAPGAEARTNPSGFGQDTGAGGAARPRSEGSRERLTGSRPLVAPAPAPAPAPTGSGRVVRNTNTGGRGDPRRSARPKPPPPPPGVVDAKPVRTAVEPAKPVQPVAQTPAPVQNPVESPVQPTPAPIEAGPSAPAAPAEQPVVPSSGVPSSADLAADETARYYDRAGLLKLFYDVARCYVVTKDIRPGELLESNCALPSTGDNFLGQAKKPIYARLVHHMREHIVQNVLNARADLPEAEHPGFDLFLKRSIEMYEVIDAAQEVVGKKPPERFVIGNSGRPKMSPLEEEAMLRIDAAIKALVSIKSKTPIAA